MPVATDVQTHLDTIIDSLARGNSREAQENFEASSAPEGAAGPEMLLLACRAHAKAGRWVEVENIAASAALGHPDESNFCAQWAWAVHQQGRTADAYQILSNAAARFSQSVAVAYSLACLNGALRRVPEARQ
ncbi:MAG TPA: hypothetical protein VGR78_05640 [Verrucomicrobiae bacterium]|jgi:hypothetical protein|nr:hypothetical protein [Verrucomicrobiae bacterium]